MTTIKKNSKKVFGVQEYTCENCSSVFTSGDYEIGRTFKELDYSIFRGRKVCFVYALMEWCPICRHKCQNYAPIDGEIPFWTHSPYRYLR